MMRRISAAQYLAEVRRIATHQDTKIPNDEPEVRLLIRQFKAGRSPEKCVVAVLTHRNYTNLTSNQMPHRPCMLVAD